MLLLASSVEGDDTLGAESEVEVLVDAEVSWGSATGKVLEGGSDGVGATSGSIANVAVVGVVFIVDVDVALLLAAVVEAVATWTGVARSAMVAC